VLLNPDGTGKRPVKGLEPGEEVLRWSGDSQALYVVRPNRPIQLFHVEPVSGYRQSIGQVNSADAFGIIGIPQFFVSADGKSFVYTFVRKISELYVVRDFIH
jgi:hypothetical protein